MEHPRSTLTVRLRWRSRPNDPDPYGWRVPHSRQELDRILVRSREVLESSWRPDAGFCPPNTTVYPHQWLWDSCFHAIAWNALDDERAVVELSACFDAQLPNGFVPHIRYLAPNTDRGPNPMRSSYTQPPIFAHAAAELARSGQQIPDSVLSKIDAALHWLWRDRLGEDGLLRIVHPWESGADDSPRWDDWIGLDAYHRPAYRKVDIRLRDHTHFDAAEVATWSSEFVAAPAAFNAFAAHAAFELAELRQDVAWTQRGAELAAAMDAALWDDDQGLWVDQAVVGGGTSVRIPTLDGVFGALVTNDDRRAARALSQLSDPQRFGTGHGLAFLPPGHARFQADQYWRGPAWPQLNYMAYVAAKRRGADDIVASIASMSLDASQRSEFAEFWDPLSGRGLGAIPQGWAALAAVFATRESSARR